MTRTSSTNRLTRRGFLALTGAAAAHATTRTLLYGAPAPVIPAGPGAVSLAGQWRFALDRDDAGTSASWFAKDLAADTHIALPGILQTQGYGDEIAAETKFIAALPRDMAWYKLPQYARYTQPGHVEVPYLSQPVRHYLGVAWYQRDVEIPAAWKGKRVALHLERTRWQTTAFVDDRQVGSCRSLVAPHDYDLGILTPGKHRLTIKIDNSMLNPPYRFDGHSVSDGEGSTWNGIVGRIELSVTSPVWIDDAQAYPNLAGKSVQVRVKIGNLTGEAGSGTVSAGGVSTPVSWSRDGGDATLDVPMPSAEPWSEFTPILQRLTVELTGQSAGDRREITFGMREIKADGKNILLNGDLFFFRSTHDGGGFPLTGYPSTEVATWKRILGTCKEWGLNGMRFHSWCPPEAAFTAADELGFYLQPECGMWNSFDPERKMLDVLRDESARLLKAYGNHPSLVMLAATNEPAGHYPEQLPVWDEEMRKADPRRLYADGVGRPAPPPGGAGHPYASDFLVTPLGRGPKGWFGSDAEAALKSIPIPTIGHEIGQWCAYPDFAVIDKFNGKGPYTVFLEGKGTGREPYMHPGNYIIMRDSAEASGLLKKNKQLAHASGRFQVACYKEEIEAALRTPSSSGYELLDLHDYLGQGGALIGLLDAFWESKGYVLPAEFRRYNNTTVPLARFRDRTFTSGQTLAADIELSHYGPKPLPSATLAWALVNEQGKPVVSGTLPPREIPRGKGIVMGRITVDLSSLPAPAHYRLVLELRGTSFHNDWPIWVYPAKVETAAPDGVTVTASWVEAKAKLATGGKVLFLSGAPEKPVPDLGLSTVPIFWNRLMNPGRTWMLGLLNDAKHPALASFPTEEHCDWQWVDLLPGTTAMNITHLPHALQPVVQPIDDWNRNLRLAMLFECTVGPGKLMATSFDLAGEGVDKRPGGPTLLHSILSYMASPAFAPAEQVGAVDFDKWIPERYNPGAYVKPDSRPSTDLIDPGQIQQKPHE
ncbi:Glycosyl hydrolases family 2, sugar binding domain [Granulicella rosea]|uniref:Glycosyl hydrolases family 2, sugar binding domain n=1 Tax=Granulicella rosea TaxID=474952 RepID=A0A239EPV6_9BACT|nr:sugar-binding domain-containing protein [Granulicella rosea]SNS46706.1 Glycosyl hydrolases family 2, sugar binding domain [Granulicella rosea]